MNRITVGLLVVGLGGLGACQQAESSASSSEEPARLQDVVVTDPNFTFATTRAVRVEFVGEAAGHQAVELFDVDGRRLMDGAFKPGAGIDVRLPVGRADSLKLRIGKGAEAIERELVVDHNNRAVADL